MKVLVVVDMQNDFIDGALGTPEAQAIVPKVVKKIEEFDGEVLWTQDTHSDDYLETQEGRLLPVKDNRERWKQTVQSVHKGYIRHCS